jgi:hypothetical protein
LDGLSIRGVECGQGNAADDELQDRRMDSHAQTENLRGETTLRTMCVQTDWEQREKEMKKSEEMEAFTKNGAKSIKLIRNHV